jgi:hypothetical protein
MPESNLGRGFFSRSTYTTEGENWESESDEDTEDQSCRMTWLPHFDDAYSTIHETMFTIDKEEFFSVSEDSIEVFRNTVLPDIPRDPGDMRRSSLQWKPATCKTIKPNAKPKPIPTAKKKVIPILKKPPTTRVLTSESTTRLDTFLEFLQNRAHEYNANIIGKYI